MAAVAQLSAVRRGVLFETRSQHLLQTHLSMTLQRIGGKDDGGVDLHGWWWVPPLQKQCAAAPHSPEAGPSAEVASERRRLRVLGQCKAERKKMGPAYVRELEGVVYSHMYDAARRERCPAVALLISESPFTKAALLRAQASPLPFLLLHLPHEDDVGADAGHAIASAVWNPALGGQNGLLGGEMELRWGRSAGVGGDGGHPSLWWRGSPLKKWNPPESQSLFDDSNVERPT